MAIGIHDLDDDDDVTVDQPANVDLPTEPVDKPEENDTFISDFLKTKGIEDYSKINFEDENGQVITRDWKDLTKEELFNILNTPIEPPTVINNTDYTEEEIEFLRQLREANLTPSQYVALLQQQLIEPTYKIDDLSDDELFILDLESRVGELTDEQAVLALNLAKQNEELYTKLVEGIRKEYKEREDYQNQQSLAQLEQELQEAFANFQRTIVDAIDQFKSVGNLELNFEDADKEELAEFMLSQDESGANYLYQALQEPQNLVKAAWFILNGDEAFNNVADYFTKLIKLVSDNQYKKGFEDGQKGNKPSVVIDNSKRNNPPTYSSIDELDD